MCWLLLLLLLLLLRLVLVLLLLFCFEFYVHFGTLSLTSFQFLARRARFEHLRLLRILTKLC